MTDRLRLQVEFNLDAEPVDGVVTDQQGAERSFHGWLQLAETIETARRSAQGGPRLAGADGVAK